MDDTTAAQPTPDGIEIARALAIARDLAKAGVPLFVAPPCVPDCARPGHDGGRGTGGSGFDLPGGWQSVPADPEAVSRWRPGWALAAVCGYGLDVLDVDPRNGGHVAEAELRAAGVWPRTYGRAATPSGGTHDLIRSLGVRKGTPYPGVDLQAGDVHGDGRGFVFISPTVKRSKVDGVARPYVWVTEPDLDALAEWGGDDDTGAVIATAMATVRQKVVSPLEPGASFDVAAVTDVRVKAYVDQAVSRELAELRKAAPRGRNNAAFRCACALIELANSPWAGVGRAELLAEFERITALLDRPDDRFSPEEAHEAWTSAARKVGTAGRPYPERTTGGAFIPWSEWGGMPPFSPAGSGSPGPVTAGDPFSDPQGYPQPVGNHDVGYVDPVENLLACMLSPGDLDRMPNPRWLVKGLLKINSESWMIGPPGGFKSFVALDIAAHVAGGSPWQGLAVRGGPVVYLVAEGADGMKLRKQAWESVYGTMSDRVRFIPFPIQAGNEAHWAVLVQACHRLAPSLIVLDTQARISVGLRENDATDMGLLVHAVNALRRATGACVLVLHHTGRNGGDARGSSALDGAQDTEVRVERPPSRRSLRCTVSLDKQKDGTEGVRVELRLAVVDLGLDVETGDDLSSLVIQAADPFADPLHAVRPDWEENLTENGGRIMAVMRDHSDEPGAVQAQILRWLAERGTPMRQTSAATALRKLRQDGLLEMIGRTRYVLPEE